MNKALIEVALLALTSAGAMAGKPPKPEPSLGILTEACTIGPVKKRKIANRP